MLVSMTGFSTKTVQLKVQGQMINATLTLRSINGRYFESTIKLPYVLTPLENELSKLLKAKLHRGTITFAVNIAQISALKGPVKIALPIVAGYLQALEELKNHFALPGTISIQDIMKLDNIFEIQEATIDEETAAGVLAGTQSIIDELISERMREGAALAKDILRRIEIMKELVNKIEPRALELIAQRKKDITQMIQEVAPSISEEQKNHHIFSLLGTIERLDVHEEITRLKTHFDNFAVCINSSEIEKGRKLDFITQEVLREFNTLASKLPDSLISAWVIAAKVELEKIREQAQNIV